MLSYGKTLTGLGHRSIGQPSKKPRIDFYPHKFLFIMTLIYLLIYQVLCLRKGAVISHVTSDGGWERLIAFASRELSSSERNYPQIALSLIYGIRKFNSYLYGQRFALEMDHKPLTAIFGSKKGIPAMIAARL